jgi:hypothetical protein
MMANNFRIVDSPVTYFVDFMYFCRSLIAFNDLAIVSSFVMASTIELLLKHSFREKKNLIKSERAPPKVSKIRGSRSWYQMKGLAKRNTHVKYESPSIDQSLVITKVKVC